MADFVTVCCKLPHGLHLDLQQPGKPKVRITLKGHNSARVVGGYGITEQVPKEHFDEWMKQNRNHPAVTGNLIFAMNNTASAESKAREYAEHRHGMEPINSSDPASDPRLGIKKAAKGEDPVLAPLEM
jgi:hypothetical protein